MLNVSFVKYEGTGNDFLLVDDRSFRFPLTLSFIQRICDRKFGVGADGLILLHDAEDSTFRMRIFNPDGSEAESCGNGLRCFLCFLRELGIERSVYHIAIGKRIVSACFSEQDPIIDMGEVCDLRLGLDTSIGVVHFVDSGVPHAVHFVSAVEHVDLPVLGARLRHHPLFQPRGVNADFASMKSDGSLQVRTFERGVEGETLSCGSGAVAVAAIARIVYGLNFPVSVQFPGGKLQVHEESGRMLLTGPVCRIFSGSF